MVCIHRYDDKVERMRMEPVYELETGIYFLTS